MHELVLNDRIVRTDLPSGTTLLDFVRYEQHLKGTKIGCREGDCGACTVLLGTLCKGGAVRYQSVTSCISPIGNAFGKHVVTIDGLALDDSLSVVQSALVAEGGTQCGFCTPGFAVSLTGYCLSCPRPDEDSAIASIDGNICRCTGYKSIERSARRVVDALQHAASLADLVEQGFIPPYFLDVPELLASLPNQKSPETGPRPVVGGGTDLYVQRPEQLTPVDVKVVSDKPKLRRIRIKANNCRIGSSATVTDLLESADMNRLFPNLKQHLKLVSSTQIRNMGTVAGNLVNASPIGDLTVFLLALNASVILKGKNKHPVALRDFYLGYKKLNKDPEDIIKYIEFPLPGKATRFNFEKVCKRTHLDIASVNSAMQISVADGRIRSVSLSAGGIGPIPTYLAGTCKFLKGKKLSAKTVKSAARMLANEISPISDARGSASYKSLLLHQLFFAHFLELFPDHFDLPDFL